MDIIVKNLCKTYDRNQVLDHFSCTFREKKMTCIMGKSGIGKSTLLSILMGLEKADEGTVSGMEHQKISAIFQENRLFENLDAVTNIHITTGKTKEEITGFLKKMELDDIAGKLADLLAELKTEKDSFKKIGIDYEEKAFYDILKAVAKKYEFDNEYPDEKMLELSKKIKVIVDDKSRYTDWSTRDDIKANLQVDLILLLDEYGYPPVTLDDVYKEVLEQAENFKKYAG